MKDYGIVAKELFLAGYNCSQAVFCAFAPDFGIERVLAMKVWLVQSSRVRFKILNLG